MLYRSLSTLILALALPSLTGGAHDIDALKPDLAFFTDTSCRQLRADVQADDLDGFERIWLLCWLDRASGFRAKVTPYLDSTSRGLFATRAPARPNPIGLSCVRLLAVEGNTLHVADLDILDGIPLLDIKPYVGRFDRFGVTRNGWLDTAEARKPQSDDRFYHRQENT